MERLRSKLIADQGGLALLFLLIAYINLFVISIGLFAIYPSNQKLTAAALIVPVSSTILACVMLFALLPVIRSKHIRLYRFGLILTSPYLIASLANVDWVISKMNPNNFQGLATKWDAVYFTVTTMATVGYGDIFPTSQLARIWVTAQIVIGVAFIGLIIQREIMAGRSDESRKFT